MSRIGNAPILLPAGVSISLSGNEAVVKGPNGELRSPIPTGIAFKEENGSIQLTRSDESRDQRQLHGLARALLNNSVIGVSKGWQKRLELHGVGYRVQLKGEELVFSLGYSHEVRYPIPSVIKVQVADQNKIDLTSIDKQKLGQVSAEIRSLRPPEPYKGKGIRYSDEVVRRKAGKTGKGKGK